MSVNLHLPSCGNAWLRNAHATTHASPIFSDSRSIELVPEETLERIVAVHGSFSRETGDAITLTAVVRHRLLANARYFSGRSDGLRLHTIEQLVTAVR